MEIAFSANACVPYWNGNSTEGDILPRILANWNNNNFTFSATVCSSIVRSVLVFGWFLTIDAFSITTTDATNNNNQVAEIATHTFYIYIEVKARAYEWIHFFFLLTNYYIIETHHLYKWIERERERASEKFHGGWRLCCANEMKRRDGRKERNIKWK